MKSILAGPGHSISGAGDGPGSLTRASSVLLLERVVRVLVTAITGIAIARHLGPNDFGVLGFVQGSYGILLPLVSLGFPSLLVREMSTGRDPQALLAAAVRLQLPVAAAVAIAVLAFVLATRGFASRSFLVAVALAPTAFAALELTFRSRLEAEGRLKAIALIGTTSVIIGGLAKLAVVALGGSLIWIAAATAVEVLLLVALSGRFAQEVRWTRSTFLTDVAGTRVTGLLSESWPLLVASVAVAAYMRLDIIMVAAIAGDKEAGIYSAAVRISELCYFLPLSLLIPLRPRLARLHAAGDEEAYLHLLQRLARLAACAAVLAIGTTLTIGSRVVAVVFGSAYEGASVVLSIHIVSALFVFLGVAVSPWFTDRSLTKVLMLHSLGGAGINLVLNLVLIPRHGAQGAAVATLVSYAVAWVVFNALTTSTRPIFVVQMRALLLWRLDNDGPEGHDRGRRLAR